MSDADRPPRMGRWLLTLRRLGSRRPEVEADLRELFALRLAARGRSVASWRYLADVVSLWKWRRGPSARLRERHWNGWAGVTHDLIFAMRLFRRHPALFGVTVAGLALAIGIATAVVSVVRSVAFAGYGAAASESVYHVALTSGVFRKITGNSPFRGQWTSADYARLRELTTSATLAAWTTQRTEFRWTPGDGSPTRVTYLAVSGNYFTALGMQAAHGRGLSPADDIPGATATVLSWGFWTNRLGSDPSIVGRTIWLGDRAYTVVGVAGRRHMMPSGYGMPPDAWVPLAAHRDAWSGQTGVRRDELREQLKVRRDDPRSDAAARDRYAAIEAELAVPPAHGIRRSTSSAGCILE